MSKSILLRWIKVKMWNMGLYLFHSKSVTGRMFGCFYESKSIKRKNIVPTSRKFVKIWKQPCFGFDINYDDIWLFKELLLFKSKSSHNRDLFIIAYKNMIPLATLKMLFKSLFWNYFNWIFLFFFLFQKDYLMIYKV